MILVAAGCGLTSTDTGPVSASSTLGTILEPVATATTTRPASATTLGPDTTLVSVPPSDTPPTSDMTVTTARPIRPPIVIGVAGDTAFTHGLDQRDPFGEVIELLSTPDLMVVNLETSVADAGVGRPPVDKPFLFKSPPASLALLVEAGVDVVGLANNHVLDFGVDALAQTLAEIDAVGLARVGAGHDENEAYAPLIVEVGAWRVGIVSLSRVPCDWSASGQNVRPQVAWACPPFADRYQAMVDATVASADVTVLMVHGGAEGVFCPSDFMVGLTRELVARGVDAVVNGHPHVLQGIGDIDGVPVVWSSGNFAFPAARGVTANSAVFLLDVSEDASGLPRVGLRVVPVRAEGGVLRLPGDAERDAILDHIDHYSTACP